MDLSNFIGKYCVVRCRDAGVHIGLVEQIEGRETVLSDSRRLWRWRGANSLSDLATTARIDREFTYLGPPIRVYLPEICEIIALDPAAKEHIYSIPAWEKRG